MNPTSEVKKNIQSALSSDELSLPFNITPSKVDGFDFQTNVAFLLSKKRRKKPLECAQEIVSAMDKSYFNYEVSGPGFINIALNEDALIAIFNKLDKYCVDRKPLGKKVVIDYSSPNVAKEFHVGHLRSTIIGDSLANTLSWLGYEVLRLNHIGDWGTAFGMLIAHIKDHYLDIVNNDKFDLSSLMTWYRESKKRFDEEEGFYERAKEEVVQLQGGDQVNKKIWIKICAQSELSYQKIYDSLGIKGLKVRGESFYNSYLPGVIEDCQDKNLLQQDDGAQCLFLEGFLNRDNEPLPLIVQKSDGGFNYSTTDLAALKQRFLEEKADIVYYVTDSGQRNHFEMIFAAGKKLGYIDNLECVKHVPFGLVLDKNKKKFKTRSGDTVKLTDLLDEGHSRARKLAIDRNLKDPDLFSQVVGMGAIKYADLSNNKLSDYVFDFDKMLAFDGNTVVYILYAFVRIQSLNTKLGFDITNELSFLSDALSFNQYERKLLLDISDFPSCLEKVSQDQAPNHLTDYLYGLSSDFHVFFQHCPIKDHSEGKKRLYIANQVANVLKKGLSLLGCDVIYEM